MSETDLDDFKKKAEALKPWKKGPYKIGELYIDSEWRSDLKWERLKSHLSHVKNKTICDVGAANGYFMFALSEFFPRYVLGLEPYERFRKQFDLLQSFYQKDRLFMSSLGVEHLTYMPKSFDIVLCLGILYHRTDPIQTLRDIHGSLKKGGEVFIDTHLEMAPGDYALFPKKKYLGASASWWIPSEEVLISWLERSGFTSVEMIHKSKLSFKEQRATEWAEIRSLREFVHTREGREKTIEGYTLPSRAYFKARKN